MSALSTLLVGTLTFSSPADMIASVELDRDVYISGQQGSYTINLNTIGTGYEVTALSLFKDPLPSAIRLPLDGHDIFSSGGDTWGNYLDGFLQGETVSGGNTIQDDRAIIMMSTSSLPGPVEPNDKAIRYDFTVRSDASLGQYSVSLDEAYVTIFTGGAPPFQDVPIDSQNLISDTFTVIPDLEMLSFCMWGPEDPGKERAPEFCLGPFDRDGNEYVDLLDVAELQVESSTQR